MGNFINHSAGKPIVNIDHKNTKADIRLVISDKNWLETNAVDQLKKTAELPGMLCGVGMPDLHAGKGQPIGAAFITRNHIYPHLVGSDIGCGMGLWKINTKARKVKLDKWEKKLTGLDDIWQEGCVTSWLKERGLETQDELLASEDSKLGTIGGGNHFAEIQKVHEIADQDALDKLNIDGESVVLLAHSGSRGLGQKILRGHVDCFGAASLHSGQTEANQYLKRHDYAVEWAKSNRALIANRFLNCLSMDGEFLLDVAHNTVTALPNSYKKSMNLKNDESIWIHRKGASPTDEGLVMIPGSRGSLSYLVKPRTMDQSTLALGGFSLAHGAGRKWKRSDARSRLDRNYKSADLEVTDLGSRVICKQKDLLYEEAPQAYKNIDLVINDLVEAGMVDLIASFKPLITYKTRKK